MTQFVYGVCLEGGEIETTTDPVQAIAKALELKTADLEACVSVVVWTDDPNVSY